jgi:hypothetical protein
MRNNPGIPWSNLPWTATSGIDQGVLKCGDRICITNRRNGATATAYVVDSGGSGSPTEFDVDYIRVFQVLDPDYGNYARGNMDIDWFRVLRADCFLQQQCCRMVFVSLLVADGVWHWYSYMALLKWTLHLRLPVVATSLSEVMC